MNRGSRFLSFLLAFVMIFLCMSGLSINITAEGKENGELSESDAKNMKLPVININTSNGRDIIQKEIYKDATMQIQLGDGFEDCVNYYTMDAGAGIKIRCRGNSSYGRNEIQTSGKYSYKIKLDVKSDLFGMGSSKHWALIANFFDITNMRNKLLYDLAGSLGMTYNDSIWCVVYMNGRYKGLYSLVETVGIGEGRVETTDWEEIAEDLAEEIIEKNNLNETRAAELTEKVESDLSWITTGVVSYTSSAGNKKFTYKVSDYIDTSGFDITSGYLIEYDGRYDSDTTKFYTENGVPIQLDSPVALSTNPEMYNYLVTLMSDFESALFSPTFCTPDGRHWTEFVDIQSFIDFWLLFNFTKNIEFGWLSIYFYVHEGKIVFGPCWDFDNASGNQVTLTDEWRRSDTWFESGRGPWWRELYSDPYFVELCKERWFEIREAVDVYMSQMDIYYEYLFDEAVKNYDKYGAPPNWYMHDIATEGYEEEFAFFRNWMYERVDWLDAQFSMRDPNIDGIGINQSQKNHFTVKYQGGTSLEADKLYTNGSPCDYLYDYESGKNIVIGMSTTHTTLEKVDVFVNGAPYKKGVVCNDEAPAEIVLEFDKLGIEDGEEMVVFFVGYNSTDIHGGAYSYISIKCTSVKNPEKGSHYVTLDGVGRYVKNNSSITFPEIEKEREGFTPVGWSDGEKVYKVGDTVTINKNKRYYVVWEQASVFELFTLYEPLKDDEGDKPVEPDYIYVEDSDAIRYVGIQEKTEDGELTLRFVSVLDENKYQKVGYFLSVEYPSHTENVTLEEAVLYSEVKGGEKTYTAESLGGKYAVLSTFDGFSEAERTVVIIVTPYAIRDGVVYKGDACRVFYLNGKLSTQNFR